MIINADSLWTYVASRNAERDPNDLFDQLADGYFVCRHDGSWAQATYTDGNGVEHNHRPGRSWPVPFGDELAIAATTRARVLDVRMLADGDVAQAVVLPELLIVTAQPDPLSPNGVAIIAESRDLAGNAKSLPARRLTPDEVVRVLTEFVLHTALN